MAFTATKREWAELCVFFQLLGRGTVQAGKTEARQSLTALPIAYVQREEHDGTRQYIIADNGIHMVGENVDRFFPREDFLTVSELILDAIKSSDDEIESPEGVEEFLDELGIYNLEAQTDDRTDLYIAFYHVDMPPIGFRIYSRIGTMQPLLDGGRAANIKFEQKGIRFPSPTVNKINSVESENTVLDRISLIERLGGELKFNDAADKIFRSNLHMIDLHFPRLVGEMVRVMFLEGISKVNELTERVKEINPLKVKDELIRKHGFYEHKVKEFLLAVAMGLRPTKLYNGQESAVGGLLILNADGTLNCYSKLDRQAFADYLFNHTRLEKGDLQKYHYGELERENGLFYFKLNLKISLLKR